MKRHRRFATLLVSVAWLAAAQCAGAQPTVLAPLKAQRDQTRTLVEGLVAQVPEDLYDFRPTPEVRSFREQFTHLIDENFRFMAQAAGEPPPMEKGAIEQLKGRDDILRALKASYDYGANVWAGMTDQTAMETIPGRGGQPQPRWAPILVQIVDNMDHYGNLVVYARLKGMVPAPSDPPAPIQARPALSEGRRETVVCSRGERHAHIRHAHGSGCVHRPPPGASAAALQRLPPGISTVRRPRLNPLQLVERPVP